MLSAGAGPFIPASKSLRVLRAASQDCHGCPLYKYATQTVFGEGDSSARILMIGQQPGNDEDLAGRPFVGPAGRVLDRALEDAGLSREQIYLTNAVKHFKFEERGKRRIHKKPSATEVQACKPWLEAEVKLVHPHLIVCLGATAAAALFGSRFRLTKDRGKALDHPWAPFALATIHPSAVLRIIDSDQRLAEYGRLVADLRAAAKLM